MNVHIPIALTSIVLASSGCTTYTPTQLASMSTYDICEAQVDQSWNIADASRHAMQSELARRKATCAQHMEAIHAKRAYELDEQTYGNQSP